MFDKIKKYLGEKVEITRGKKIAFETLSILVFINMVLELLLKLLK